MLLKEVASHRTADGVAAGTEPKGLGQGIPPYAAALACLHCAFRQELYDTVSQLPLRRNDRVLDSPCGDGFYSGCLSEQLGPCGEVVAVDANGDYLTRAQAALEQTRGGPGVAFVLADAYRLPFAEASFDLAWCAQSMVSLDPIVTLRELHRVVRPGGYVAVLENDDFHHVLLPWPVELELAVQRAFVLSCRERFGNAWALYRGRRLARTLRDAGLVPWRRTTHAIDRQAPLRSEDRDFFAQFFGYLRDLAVPHLGPAEACTLLDLTDSGSPRYLLDQPDFEATYLFTVAIGRRPL
jgi:demethylmenaquinone methyltransferase / 2-methoxy-6-polyprenyl-1,4-benzoquinol methylase